MKLFFLTVLNNLGSSQGNSTKLYLQKCIETVLMHPNVLKHSQVEWVRTRLEAAIFALQSNLTQSKEFGRGNSTQAI